VNRHVLSVTTRLNLMDIDDILREVDPGADSVPRETRDLQALTRAWVAERCAPELRE
jgi:GINS complex subunit 4